MTDDEPTTPVATEEHEPMREGAEAPPRGVRMMAIGRWVLVGLMAVAAVASILHYTGALGAEEGGAEYYCPMHPWVVQDGPGECPICHMTLQPKPDDAPAAPAAAAAGDGAYYCPMHPEVTSDDPAATCDLCGGMKLVPRPPASAQPAGAGMAHLPPIELEAERVQLLGVKTAPVRRHALAATLATIGTVTASEAHRAVVDVRAAGWIQTVLVGETGTVVKKGQVVATLSSPDLTAAQAELVDAMRWASPADPHHGAFAPPTHGLATAARRRLEILGMASADIARVEKTKKPLAEVPLRAPIAGTVTDKLVVAGTYVQPGTELFRIADLREVWVLAELFETELARVAPGQTAVFTSPALPGQPFPSRIDLVIPSIDARSRTARARLVIDNRDRRLLPGMVGDVAISLAGAEALTVPRDALIETGEGAYVFVALEGGRFEPHRVEPGARVGGEVEIRSGLAEGQLVVTTGNFLLDAESRLRATFAGTAPAAAPAAPTTAPAAPAAPITTPEKKSPRKAPRAPAAPTAAEGPCDGDFSRQKFPDKHRRCVQCETVHRGMPGMLEDCRSAIPKPWK